jgi:hypothetical protein
VLPARTLLERAATLKCAGSVVRASETWQWGAAEGAYPPSPGAACGARRLLRPRPPYTRVAPRGPMGSHVLL